VKILVTGGAGFIGSAVCRHLINDTDHSVVNLDKLTYAASLGSVASIEADPRYRFVQGDILDRAFVADLLKAEQPDGKPRGPLDRRARRLHPDQHRRHV
jgi:dTDP-glucose 4,6-dehydratase